MAIYTKKEFAKMCGFGTNQLSVDIGRGKVTVVQKKVDNKVQECIDSNNEKNKLYLEKKFGRADLAPSPEAVRAESKKKKATNSAVDDDGDEDMPQAFAKELGKLIGDENVKDLSYPDLEKIYKYRQGESLKKRIERDQLAIDRQKGVVIPSETVLPSVLQHNQHILMSQKNADEEMLQAFAHKYSIDPDDVAYIRGEWINRRNAAMKEATEMTKKSVEILIKDYADKRGD